MRAPEKRFEVRLAADAQDILAAQRLRYSVFVEELGAAGPTADHATRTERDTYDETSDHLLLIDRTKSPENADHVVGVYRMMTNAQAEQAGGFYSASEYDLTRLIETGRPLLELGRSCVHADFRGGTSMYLLWNALARLVLDRGIEIMFGVASFHGTDVERLKAPLSYLHHNHLAPEELRVTVLPEHAQNMDLLDPDQIDRVEAMRDIPALIKAYLRLGGFVGKGAFIDHAFNTTDVCLVMDTEKMNAKSKDVYVRKASR